MEPDPRCALDSLVWRDRGRSCYRFCDGLHGDSAIIRHACQRSVWCVALPAHIGGAGVVNSIDSRLVDVRTRNSCPGVSNLVLCHDVLLFTLWVKPLPPEVVDWAHTVSPKLAARVQWFVKIKR